MTDTAVFLFHREFRLYDNTGLNAIARSGNKIIPVFIFTPQQLDSKRNKYFSNVSVAKKGQSPFVARKEKNILFLLSNSCATLNFYVGE